MSSQHPVGKPSPAGSDTSSDHGGLGSKSAVDDKVTVDAAPPTAPALATQQTQRMEAAMGDAILRFFRIRKGPKAEEYDLDAVSISAHVNLRKTPMASNMPNRLPRNRVFGIPRMSRSIRASTSTRNGRTGLLLIPVSDGHGERNVLLGVKSTGKSWYNDFDNSKKNAS